MRQLHAVLTAGLLTAALGGALTACQSIVEQDVGPRIATQFLTLKIVGQDPDRAEALLEVTDAMAASIKAAGTVDRPPTVAELEAELRGHVPWGDLDDTRYQIADRLFTRLREELEDRYGTGPMSEEARLATATVVEWVADTAETEVARE